MSAPAVLNSIAERENIPAPQRAGIELPMIDPRKAPIHTRDFDCIIISITSL